MNTIWNFSIIIFRPLRALLSVVSCLKICSSEALLNALFALHCQMPFWECYAPRGQNSLLLLSPERIPAREQVILSHNQTNHIFTDFSLTLGVTRVSCSYSLTSPRTLTIQTAATNSLGHFYNEGSQLSRQRAAKILSPIDSEWMLLKPPNFHRFPYWFHRPIPQLLYFLLPVAHIS